MIYICKLRILILCCCLTLSSVAVQSKDFSDNQSLINYPNVQNGFPNIFRPIGNIFNKIIGKKRREIVCYVASVSNLTLSRNEVVASCSNGKHFCFGSKEIGIYTEAFNPSNDVITYVYSVSGGKIIGQGDKVVWDLSGEKPGTYTITAGVDDSCGVCGQTMTKTATVTECPNCQ